MFKRIAVTNRSLCSAGLEEQVEKICKERLCEALILREKDLSEQDYLGLAMTIKAVCDEYGVDFICNNMPSVAEKLGCKMQLSYQSFLEQNWERDTYALIAGHIFMTDCKKGLAPRGLDFLKDICRAVSIPVFAIGGIDDSNSEAVKLAGAQGECRMSWYMRY